MGAGGAMPGWGGRALTLARGAVANTASSHEPVSSSSDTAWRGVPTDALSVYLRRAPGTVPGYVCWSVRGSN